MNDASDESLLSRLAEFKISAANPNFDFDPANQIRSCSIDLRLSDVIWQPRKGAKIDLSNDEPLGANIDRAFTRKRISYPDGYRLKPGEFVLGRTYEKFEIPNDLTGRLIDRSSFGRLGLSVASMVNLVNPGWSGHMPLAIINNSPFQIILQPFIGIVQIGFYELTSVTQIPYNSPEAHSKYIDDDGGPSRYWLDRTIVDLRENHSLRRISQKSIKCLENFSEELDEPTRRRFNRFVSPYGTVSDLKDLFAAFVISERLRWSIFPGAPILISLPAAILVSWLPSLWAAGWDARIIAGCLTLASIVGVLWIGRAQWGTTISPGELSRIARTAQKTTDVHS